MPEDLFPHKSPSCPEISVPFAVTSQQARSPSEFLILLWDVLSIQTQFPAHFPSTPSAAHRKAAGTWNQDTKPTPNMLETLPGKDSLETALSIHLREQTSFQEQRLLHLRNHSHGPDLQSWGKAFTVAPGASPSLSAQRTAISWAPTCTALDGHLFPPSPFLSDHFIFHFKTIQLCLGDEQNEMSLTYKERNRRESHASHYTRGL